jgi:hypothetical protein
MPVPWQTFYNTKNYGFTVKTLINEQATRRGILRAYRQLLNNFCSCSASKQAFLCFAAERGQTLRGGTRKIS